MLNIWSPVRLCFHPLRWNKPALIHRYESTGSAPRVDHASSPSPETSGGALLASSLPNYSTHLLSPTSRRRRRSADSPEKQQLGLPAAHPHPKGFKCSDVVLVWYTTLFNICCPVLCCGLISSGCSLLKYLGITDRLLAWCSVSFNGRQPPCHKSPGSARVLLPRLIGWPWRMKPVWWKREQDSCAPSSSLSGTKRKKGRAWPNRGAALDVMMVTRVWDAC